MLYDRITTRDVLSSLRVRISCQKGEQPQWYFWSLQQHEVHICMYLYMYIVVKEDSMSPVSPVSAVLAAHHMYFVDIRHV